MKTTVAAALGTFASVCIAAACTGSSRSTIGADVVVPYKVSAVSPVRIRAFGNSCRPERRHVADIRDWGDVEDGSLGFYVFFRSGGQHRETLVCSDGDKSKRISIRYVPGQIDTARVPVAESGVNMKQCAGMLIPAVHYIDGLIFAVSDPENALRLTVRLRRGTQVIQTQGDLFELYGLPKQPPGFRYDVYSPHKYQLLPKTTYQIEVAFQKSWAASGICPAFFRVGELKSR